MFALLIGRLRQMLCRRGATASSGYLATLMLCRDLSGLGDVGLRVGSHVLGRLVGLAGYAGFLLFCHRRFVSLLVFLFFSLFLVIRALV